MKKISINILIAFLVLLMAIPVTLFAGNEQRAGQAGASELLINPWARSSGWGGANTSGIKGLEAVFSNVAGLAFTNNTDLIFVNTQWFADIGINAFGFAQKVGESGVISLSVMTVDYGEIPITTVDLPEGGIGTFHPQNSVIALAFAKEFSNSIYGGMTIKIISESISDLTAGGVCFDAGIQYVTGSEEQIKFGVSMKNVGPTMKYKGDGLSFRGIVPESEVDLTVEQRSQDFELPSLITIGASYDFNFSEKTKLIAAGNFTSNSFTRDQFHLGFEFVYQNILFLRAGYVHEKGNKIFGNDFDTRATAFTGPSLGFSLQIPINKNGSIFSLDYSYRDTDPFNGVHTIGATVSL